MINLVVDGEKEKSIIKKVSYTFFYLTEAYDCEISASFQCREDCVNIFYGTDIQGKGNIYIPRNEIETTKVVRDNNTVYLAFDNDEDGPPFVMRDGNVIFTFDIIKSSYYLISCCEEYGCKLRDSMNRFLSKYSSRKEEIDIPFFDLNSKFLFNALKLVDNDVKLKDRPFEIMLTHDVDSINSRDKYVLLHNIKELFNGTNYSLTKRISTVFSDLLRNRHLQIENYIQIESQRGARSEFYFIEGQRHRLGKRYELSSIKNEIKHLEDMKFKIGIHTNFFSYDDENKVRAEKENIEKYTGRSVVSCRNHYLRFSVPDTWRVLRDAGILCDTTLGYSDRNGFRAGTTKAFIPYDAIENKLIDIIEVPLTVMDGIVMEQKITQEDKWMEIKNIIDKVAEYKGSSSLLWHQRVIYDENYKDMYQRILDYICQSGGRYVLSEDMIQRKEQHREKLNHLFKLTDIS
jgi:hypothetical protein